MLKTGLICLFSLYLFYPGTSSGQSTLFKDFIMMDGSGKLPSTGDIRIRDDKIAMKSKWGMADMLLQRLDKARERSVQITADVYPYDFWFSTLEVHFPKRDFDNKSTAEFALRELTPPKELILSRYDAIPAYEGKSLAEIAIELQLDPADTYIYLIKTAREKKALEYVMGRSMTENDIIRLIIDKEKVRDNATLLNPLLLSSGIEQVWVNGKLVWNGQRYTGRKAGVVIKGE